MMYWTELYPGWFSDLDSLKCCEHMNVRPIPVSAWVDAVLLSSVVLPADFQLQRYAQLNKLHILCFLPGEREYEKTLVHPDLFFKLVKRTLRQVSKPQSERRVFLYGNKSIH